MVRQIAPNGDTMSFDHAIAPDGSGGTEVTTDFNGNETQYSYDSRGNVLTKRDNAGNEWSYTYDSLDNQTGTRNPDQTTRGATFDAQGNELTSTDERGATTTRTYNARGQVVTEEDAQAPQGPVFDGGASSGRRARGRKPCSVEHFIRTIHCRTTDRFRSDPRSALYGACGTGDLRHQNSVSNEETGLLMLSKKVEIFGKKIQLAMQHFPVKRALYL
jgi:YD repeat-containing protein